MGAVFDGTFWSSVDGIRISNHVEVATIWACSGRSSICGIWFFSDRGCDAPVKRFAGFGSIARYCLVHSKDEGTGFRSYGLGECRERNCPTANSTEWFVVSQPASPIVSIVTVTLNNLTGLKRTCTSIAIQSIVGKVEHVVVDGLSDDGSAEWYLAHVPTSNYRLVSEADDGIFDAMNKGWKIATGEYVIFMNAGDAFATPDALDEAVSQLREAGADWGYGRGVMADERGGIVRRADGPRPYSKMRHQFGTSWICHQSVVMRRSLIQELDGFDLRYDTAADYHALMRAALLADPTTWQSTTAICEVGGVSDVRWKEQLRLHHLARVDVLKFGKVRSGLDTGLMNAQVNLIRLRKVFKRPIATIMTVLTMARTVE